MKDSAIIKIALAWSIIGMFILVCIALFTQVPIYDVSDLELMLNKNVRVIGDVTKIDVLEKVTFITLKDNTGEIKIVYFDKPKFNESNKIDVVGNVKAYKSELEIVASQIICVSC